MKYFYTARFLRSLKKCDSVLQDDIISAITLFEKKQNIETLKIHKLHGKFKPYYAFSANFSYRILVKMTKDAVYYLDVGTHDIYL
jgi:mRNA-degrading endonuclease YafQ of YafQ-DinJ toxin-antitoxin module